MLLVISGFDPSGHAGMLVDVRVAQARQQPTMVVISAQTVQTVDQVSHLEWVDRAIFQQQLRSLFDSQQANRLGAIKIGLFLQPKLMQIFLAEYESFVQRQHWLPIVFDPVLSTSSGFDFWGEAYSQDLLTQLKRLFEVCFCITPNGSEWRRLEQSFCPTQLPENMRLLITDVDARSKAICSLLYHNAKPLKRWRNKRLNFEIRGTGCALSTLIATFLAEFKQQNPAAYLNNDSLIEGIDRSLLQLTNWIESSTNQAAKNSPIALNINSK